MFGLWWSYDKQRQRQKAKAVQGLNTGVSPLRRQSAPPSVEMTRIFVGEENKRQPKQIPAGWQIKDKRGTSERAGDGNSDFSHFVL
jgi:hypothetical protein